MSQALGSGVVAAMMVGAWGYRSIFVVLICAVIASLLILLRVAVPPAVPASAAARPVDAAALPRATSS
jgi:hypothetical protein